MTLAAAVADEVQRRMTARGLSQNALAKRAGMAPTLLHRAMSGERDLRLDELERIAPVLGVSAVWLVRSALTRTPPTGDSSETNSGPRQV